VSWPIADLWSDETGPAARADRLPGCTHARSAAVASGWSGPGQLQSRAGAREEGEDVAEGGFLAGGSAQREVRLDLVAVAAAVFMLHQVAGCGRLGDDAAGALRSVMSRLAAMSRSRAPGSRVMHGSAQAWLAGLGGERPENCPVV
jgi:hypothetical protein